MADIFPAVKWVSGTITVFDIPDTATFGYAACVSNDGTKVFGYSNPGQTTNSPYRWDGATATAMHLLGVDTEAPESCSSAGGVIVGSASMDPGGGLEIWTSGGSASVIATAGAGYTDPSIVQVPPGQRVVTPDGTVIVGKSVSGGGANTQATTWNSSGTPTLLAAPYAGLTLTAAVSCNAAGTTVVGYGTNLSSVVVPLIWVSGTGYGLTCASTATASVVTDDSSVVYGQADFGGGGTGCYWDGLVLSGSIIGTIHQLDLLPDGSFTSITAAATAPTGPPVCAGGADNLDGLWAVRWTGTTAQKLDLLPDGGATEVYACNADGSIIVGRALDVDGIHRAVYWDNAGAIHRLAEPPGTSFSEAVNVTPDGLTIIGDIAYDPDAAPPPPPLMSATRILRVSRGRTAQVFSSSLSASGDDTPANMIFTVTTAAAHGALHLNGTVTTSFNQADINAGLLSFTENGDDVTTDQFLFTVSDPTTGAATIGPEPFDIVVVDRGFTIGSANGVSDIACVCVACETGVPCDAVEITTIPPGRKVC